MNEHPAGRSSSAPAQRRRSAPPPPPALYPQRPPPHPTPNRPEADRPARRRPRPVVAYVSDADSGQVTVMRGDDEVVLTDHDLARRLTGQVR